MCRRRWWAWPSRAAAFAAPRFALVFFKRSLNPGFAGIENELFYDPKVSIVLGDAKHTLTKVLSSVKSTA